MHPARHASDDYADYFFSRPRQYARYNRHAKSRRMKRKTVHDCLHLRMRLFNYGNNFWPREKRSPVFTELNFDRLRADRSEMALPLTTNGSVAALDGVNEPLALAMDLR